MPRSRKCRKVCCLPENNGFLPVRGNDEDLPVILNVDEYETLRLIDREGFSQEQCGEYMHIGRTTVQKICSSARKKIADALVEGRPIQISGGDYELCDGNEEYCGCGGCQRHRHGRIHIRNQEERKMRVAVPLDENKEDVCIVLARAPYFLFQEDSREEIVENPAAEANSGAGMQAAQFLVDQNVAALITVRCGQNAADVFHAAGIKIYKSVNKTAADDLKAYDEKQLEELTQFHGGFHGKR